MAFGNKLLLGLLALLGFTQCDIAGAVEYGTPNCNFTLKGKVQNEQGEPINKVRIITRMLRQDSEAIYYAASDTVEVNGTYRIDFRGVIPDRACRVVCEDPAGVYRADSTEVKVEPTGGDGKWYQGSDTKEVNFTLKKEAGQ
jgi:putative lipoprotein (rSAM/lipoprotein system)